MVGGDVLRGGVQVVLEAVIDYSFGCLGGRLRLRLLSSISLAPNTL